MSSSRRVMQLLLYSHCCVGPDGPLAVRPPGCCCFSRFSRQLMSGERPLSAHASSESFFSFSLDPLNSSTPLPRDRIAFSPLFLAWRLKSAWCVCVCVCFLRFPPKSLIYLVLVCWLPAALVSCCFFSPLSRLVRSWLCPRVSVFFSTCTIKNPAWLWWK